MHHLLLTPGESKSSRLIAGRITLAGAESPPTDCPTRPWSRSESSTTGRPITRAPRTAVRCGAPLCVDAALGLVLVGWLLAVLPFAEHARGDRERGVDERDLDLPVTVGSPLDERQGDHDPLGVVEGLARGGAGWLGIHGPDLHAGQGPGLVLSTPTGAALLVTSTQRLPEAKTIKNRVHLDPTTGADDRAGEIERLLQLGARRVDIGQTGAESWTVLADPEGNERCAAEENAGRLMAVASWGIDEGVG